jgi:molybdate transport system substrate-binding protein
MDNLSYMAYGDGCACPEGGGYASPFSQNTPQGVWAGWIGWIAALLCVVLSGCSVQESAQSPFENPAAPVQNQPMDGGVAANGTVELTLSAASSLADVMEQLAAVYHKQQPAVRLILNTGASGSLRRQIEEGAPIDMFFSASTAHMEALMQQQLVEVEQCTNLLGNRIVMIVPGTGSDSVPGTTKRDALSYLQEHACKRIAMGDPGSVPAGEYASHALRDMDLLVSVTPKLVYGKSVREVLSWVEMGNADAAFVFQTDALQSEKVSVVASLSEKWTGPILYPLAVLRGSRQQEAAKDLLAWLGGDEAWKIFEEAGFVRIGK